MARRPLIAGNWKMHTSIAEAEALALALMQGVQGVDDRDIVVAPPFTALFALGRIVAGSAIKLAAQNVCWEEKGAFTGEISPVMLKDVGCHMALVGHSERRHVFKESDEMINQRLGGALHFGLTVVLCVGETLAQREKGETFTVLEGQVKKGLAGVSPLDPGRLILAYEPVWAIGTGRTATVEQAQEVHIFLRKLLAGLYEKNIATEMRILYGGSVTPQNVDALMAQPDVDGVLVGGASLKAESFLRIVRYQ